MVLIFSQKKSPRATPPWRGSRGVGLSLLAALLLAALPTQAQYLGQVSPQTTVQEVFGAASTTGTCAANTFSANVRNVGQSAHHIAYSISGGTVTGLQIALQFSDDGTTFQTFSNIGTNAPGLIPSTGFFPIVRAAILGCTVATGTPLITATYSGTSVSFGEPSGLELTSGTNVIQVASGSDATVTS
ncbi:MAG: hypothetical protein V3U28_06730, partial [Candidatus Acidoferrales bacterium]